MGAAPAICFAADAVRLARFRLEADLQTPYYENDENDHQDCSENSAAE